MLGNRDKKSKQKPTIKYLLVAVISTVFVSFGGYFLYTMSRGEKTLQKNSDLKGHQVKEQVGNVSQTEKEEDLAFVGLCNNEVSNVLNPDQKIKNVNESTTNSENGEIHDVENENLLQKQEIDQQNIDNRFQNDGSVTEIKKEREKIEDFKSTILTGEDGDSTSIKPDISQQRKVLVFENKNHLEKEKIEVQNIKIPLQNDEIITEKNRNEEDINNSDIETTGVKELEVEIEETDPGTGAITGDETSVAQSDNPTLSDNRLFIYVPDSIDTNYYKILTDPYRIVQKTRELNNMYQRFIIDLKKLDITQNKERITSVKEESIEHEGSFETQEMSHIEDSNAIIKFSKILELLTEEIIKSIRSFEKKMIIIYTNNKDLKIEDKHINLDNNFIYFYLDLYPYLLNLRKANDFGSETATLKLNELKVILTEKKYHDIEKFNNTSELNFDILNESFINYKKKLDFDIKIVDDIEQSIFIVNEKLKNILAAFKNKENENLNQNVQTELLDLDGNEIEEKINDISDLQIKNSIQTKISDFKRKWGETDDL